MKRLKSILTVSLLFTALFFVDINVSAQDNSLKDLQAITNKEIKKDKIDSSKIWNTGGLFHLSLGQGSQSNWAAGGDDFSFSINAGISYYAFYKKGRYSWDNTLDFHYGLVNTTSLGTRKNDDRIDLLSKVGYELRPKLNLAGLVNFRSQFANGYSYTGTSSKELLSNFLAPGYLLLSVGLDYKPTPGLSIFVSPLTSRWTFVANDELSDKGAYGVTPGEKVRNEIGAFASINYLTNLSETITYNGKLDLFSNYGHNPQNIDVYMTNKFNAQLSKTLVASLALDLIYDDDVKIFGENKNSPALQLRSLIGVGLNVKL